MPIKCAQARRDVGRDQPADGVIESLDAVDPHPEPVPTLPDNGICAAGGSGAVLKRLPQHAPGNLRVSARPRSNDALARADDIAVLDNVGRPLFVGVGRDASRHYDWDPSERAARTPRRLRAATAASLGRHARSVPRRFRVRRVDTGPALRGLGKETLASQARDTWKPRTHDR